MRRALELGLEVGRALAFAHAQGLVHRDVKPQNVLLNGDGRGEGDRLRDRPLARRRRADTQTGTVLGTSHYIAPEQARGERVDAQTDVYSFGVVLYELLTGDVPFAGESFLAVAMQHVNDAGAERARAPAGRAAAARRRWSSAAWRRTRPSGPARWTRSSASSRRASPSSTRRPASEATMIVKPPAAPGEPAARRAAPAPAAARSRCSLAVLLARRRRSAAILLREPATAATRTAAGGDAVGCSGVASYDPPTGATARSTDERVRHATDGDPATYWTTETLPTRWPRSRASASCSTRATARAVAGRGHDRHARLHGRDPGRRLAAGPVRARSSATQDRRRQHDLGARRRRRRATTSSGSPTARPASRTSTRSTARN